MLNIYSISRMVIVHSKGLKEATIRSGGVKMKIWKGSKIKSVYSGCRHQDYEDSLFITKLPALINIFNLERNTFRKYKHTIKNNTMDKNL